MKSTNRTSAASKVQIYRESSGRSNTERPAVRLPRALKSSTINAAGKLYQEHGSWRAAGEAVGLSKATVWHIAHGHAANVSPDTEREFRRRAGVGGSRRHAKRPWVPADLQRALDDLDVDFVEACWTGVQTLQEAHNG